MRTGGLIETLPAPSRWDYGGYPYGLEPLTLPDPPGRAARPGARPGAVSGMELESSRRSLRTLGAVRDPVLSSAPDPVDRLFWFRWITGHQTTFILWQLLARAVKQGAGGDEVAAAQQDACRIFVRGYSAMLLYTGSCPREVYQQVVRPSMALQHPGFSGAWARDFWPVRGLIRTDGAEPPDCALARECALNVLIHGGIAEKLVPGGQSLLNETAGRPDIAWRRSTLAVLYDTYFLTLRAEVPYPVVVGQLMRRLHAIGRDLAANGLYPSYASSAEERPPSLCTEPAEECARAIPETLFAVATEAVGDLEAWEGQ
jgi:hypothetical protein